MTPQPVTTPSPLIISLGDLVADLIVSIPTLPAEAGRHQVAQNIQLEPGGGANFLIAGARLGQPMAAIGALGDDEWGRRITEILQTEGVNMAGVRHRGSTTLVIVLVSRQGEHVFLGKYGHSDTIEPRPADVDLIRRCGAIFCAGYSLAEPRLVDLALESMRLARRLGRPVFFDPGPQIASVPTAVRAEALALTDTLLLTEEEIPLLASHVDRLGPPTVVVKQGRRGCTVIQKGAPPVAVPGFPVPVRDTSAAGDSFNAAYIAATLRGWSPAACARLANAVGAAKVKKLGGGRNVPTLAEVRAIIDEFHVELELL